MSLRTILSFAVALFLANIAAPSVALASCPELEKLEGTLTCTLRFTGFRVEPQTLTETTKWRSLSGLWLRAKFSDYTLSAGVRCAQPKGEPLRSSLFSGLIQNDRRTRPHRKADLFGLNYSALASSGKSIEVKSDFSFSPKVEINGSQMMDVEYSCKLRVRRASSD